MTDELANRTVGILVAPGSSEADVAAVLQALAGVGARPVALAVDDGSAGDGWESCPVEEASADELDGLVVPGGIAGADRLRGSVEAVSLVRQIFVAGKPVGTIGHGAWLLIEAGIAAGRSVAAPPAIRTGLANAGGSLADEVVRVERHLVTARGSEELAAFVGRLVEVLGESVERRRARPPERPSRVDRLSEWSFPASDPGPGPSHI